MEQTILVGFACYLNTSSWFAMTDLWSGECPKWSRAGNK